MNTSSFSINPYIYVVYLDAFKTRTFPEYNAEMAWFMHLPEAVRR